MSFAVADWLLNYKINNTQALIDTIVYFADKYPCPMGGYGSGFYNWLVYPKTSFEEIEREMAQNIFFIKRNENLG